MNWTHGATWDGQYLWAVDFETKQIHQIQVADGALLTSVPTPGTESVGLTWDGSYLWTDDFGTDSLYQLDPVDGQVVRALPSPHTNPRDLAWDGRYLWVVTGFDGQTIYQVDVGDVGSEVQVSLDLKPGSCPNPMNLRGNHDKGKAVLPAAILGAEDLDVQDIDPATLALLGVVAPIRWSLNDIATPVSDPEDSCTCSDEGPDGHQDLQLKFLRREIIEALSQMQDARSDGDRPRDETAPAMDQPWTEQVFVTITGNLADGTPIKGHDCLLLLHADRAGTTPTQAARRVRLMPSHPNPFNPITNLSFTLPEADRVSLEIFNIMGQRVAMLVDEWLDAGEHTVSWDASRFASGVYLYRLRTSTHSETRRMMYLK
jgi:hypothetical protein